MKKVLKVIGIIVLVLVLAFVMLFFKTFIEVFRENRSAKQEPTATPVVSEKPVEKLYVDEVMSVFDEAMQKTFGESGAEYSITQQDNVILINVWSAGITEEALKAKEDSSYKTDWDNMVSNFLTAQSSMQKKLDNNGHADIIAMLNIVNDVNPERIILSVAKGQVMYDAVNGIDKLS